MLKKIITNLRVWHGSLCPEHHAPTFWQESDGTMHCSVTKQRISVEYRTNRLTGEAVARGSERPPVRRLKREETNK